MLETSTLVDKGLSLDVDVVTAVTVSFVVVVALSETGWDVEFETPV